MGGCPLIRVCSLIRSDTVHTYIHTYCHIYTYLVLEVCESELQQAQDGVKLCERLIHPAGEEDAALVVLQHPEDADE